MISKLLRHEAMRMSALPESAPCRRDENYRRENGWGRHISRRLREYTRITSAPGAGLKRTLPEGSFPPLVAGGTDGTRARMLQVTMENIARAFLRQRPLGTVNGAERGACALRGGSGRKVRP